MRIFLQLLISSIGLSTALAAQQTPATVDDYKGWNKFKIGTPYTDVKNALQEENRLSFLQVNALIYLTEQEGYIIDENKIDTRFYRISLNGNETYFNSRIVGAMIGIDAQQRISSVLLEFNTSESAKIANQIAAKTKTVAPEFPKYSSSCNHAWKKENYTWALFAKTQLDSIAIDECYVRYSKTEDTPEKEIQTVRAAITGRKEIPEGFTGFGELKLGAKLSALKSYLDPAMVYSYDTQLAMKEEPTADKEEFGERDHWRVKKTLKQFSVYKGVPVKFIQLYFDENEVLTDVLIVFADTPTNKDKLETALFTDFGRTMGSVGIDEETGEPNNDFFWTWRLRGTKVLLMNFNNTGYKNPDKVIYLNFSGMN